MSRDKQIEEMMRIINRANGEPDDSKYSEQDATDLYNAGYRKAPDVAREIFEEIEDCYVQMLEEADHTIEEAILAENRTFARTAKYGKDIILLTLDTLRKRLKKKYTEGEG